MRVISLLENFYQMLKDDGNSTQIVLLLTTLFFLAYVWNVGENNVHLALSLWILSSIGLPKDVPGARSRHNPAICAQCSSQKQCQSLKTIKQSWENKFSGKGFIINHSLTHLFGGVGLGLLLSSSVAFLFISVQTSLETGRVPTWYLCLLSCIPWLSSGLSSHCLLFDKRQRWLWWWWRCWHPGCGHSSSGLSSAQKYPLL